MRVLSARDVEKKGKERKKNSTKERLIKSVILKKKKKLRILEIDTFFLITREFLSRRVLYKYYASRTLCFIIL